MEGEKTKYKTFFCFHLYLQTWVAILEDLTLAEKTSSQHDFSIFANDMHSMVETNDHHTVAIWLFSNCRQIV